MAVSMKTNFQKVRSPKTVLINTAEGITAKVKLINGIGDQIITTEAPKTEIKNLNNSQLANQQKRAA